MENQQKKQVQDECLDLIRSNDELIDSIADVNDTLNSRRDEIKECKDELKELEHLYSQNTENYWAKVKYKEELNSLLAHLNKSLDESSNENRNLRTHLNEVENDLNIQKNEITRKKNEIEHLKSERSFLSGSLKEVENRRKELQKELSTLKLNFQVSQTENENIKKEYEIKELFIDDLEFQVRNDRTKLDETQKKVRDGKIRLENSTQELKELGKTSEELNKKSNELKEVIKAYDVQILDIKGKLTRLETHFSERSKEIESLAAIKKANKNEIEALIEQEKILIEKNKILTSKNRQSVEDIKSNQNKIDQLKEINAKVSSQVAILEKENISLIGSAREKMLLIEKQESEIKLQQNAIASLNEGIRREREICKAVAHSAEQNRLTLKNNEESYKNLKHYHEDIMKDVARYKSNISRDEQEIQLVKNKYIKTKNELTKLEKNKAKYRDEIELQNREVLNQLKQDYARVKLEVETLKDQKSSFNSKRIEIEKEISLYTANIAKLKERKERLLDNIENEEEQIISLKQVAKSKKKRAAYERKSVQLAEGYDETAPVQSITQRKPRPLDV